MDHKSRTAAENHARANHILKGAGAPAAKMAVRAHEAHMHATQKPTKLAKGGSVKGPKAVNVIIHTGSQAEKQLAAQQGMQQGVKMGAAMGAQARPPQGAPPPRPPMAGPPGAPPPGAGPMAKGGMVKVRGHERRKAGGRV